MLPAALFPKHILVHGPDWLRIGPAWEREDTAIAFLHAGKIQDLDFPCWYLWGLELEENIKSSVLMDYKAEKQGKQYTMEFKFQRLDLIWELRFKVKIEETRGANDNLEVEAWGILQAVGRNLVPYLMRFPGWPEWIFRVHLMKDESQMKWTLAHAGPYHQWWADQFLQQR